MLSLNLKKYDSYTYNQIAHWYIIINNISMQKEYKIRKVRLFVPGILCRDI